MTSATIGRMKIDDDGRVRAAGVLLMTRRTPRQFLLMRHPRRWDLPKGHVDEGEDFQTAARRELTEETGIDPAQCQFDDAFGYQITYPVTYKKHPGRTFEKILRYFLAYVDGPVEVVVSEHEDYRWFDWTPPHLIQTQTIDGLLAAVEEHLRCRADRPGT